MIEGESDFVGEEDMMRAIEIGHAAVRDLCLGEHLPPSFPLFPIHVAAALQLFSTLWTSVNDGTMAATKKKMPSYDMPTRATSFGGGENGRDTWPVRGTPDEMPLLVLSTWGCHRHLGRWGGGGGGDAVVFLVVDEESKPINVVKRRLAKKCPKTDMLMTRNTHVSKPLRHSRT